MALIPVRSGRSSDATLGNPRDVGDAVLYFASEVASFVTGQSIAVNGGMTSWC